MATLPPLATTAEHTSQRQQQQPLTPRRSSHTDSETAAKVPADHAQNGSHGSATSPEQLLIKRLREKNRSLEEELTTLVMRREEHYQKQMREAQKEYDKVLDEKRAEQAQWYETRRREVTELKAAFKIAFSIYMARKRALHTQIVRNESTFKEQLEANMEETERLRSDFTAKLDERTQEYAGKLRDCEAQLAKVTKQADVQANQIRHLEVQLQQERQDRQKLTVRYEQQLAEAILRKESHGETGPQISDGHLQRHAREIRAIRKKAAMEKQELEQEILSYVRFIMTTQEGRGNSFLDKLDWSEALLQCGATASGRSGCSTSHMRHVLESRYSADWQASLRMPDAGDAPASSARSDSPRKWQK